MDFDNDSITDQSSEIESPNGFSRKEFMKNIGGAMLSGGMLASLPFSKAEAKESASENASGLVTPKTPRVDRVAADPRDIPDPISRRTPKTHNVTLAAKEVVAEIEDGVTFKHMTWNGQVPGPMIRVRQGDTVNLTVKNLPENTTIHNVDFHAVYGTGGCAVATTSPPGQESQVSFKATYPGAFIYHCAVPRLDMHISSGMYGMIVVEPPEGLPEVDHEFYFGQNEVYTDKEVGEKGMHNFHKPSMMAENPTYVLLNGEKNAITPSRYGALQVDREETARVFMVTGGPNLTSSFHAIGNVWSKAWREGAIHNTPDTYLQTCQVAPGSCGVFQMDFPVPEKIMLVDHALTRYAKKGMLGIIKVNGQEQPDIFDAS